MKQVSDQVAGGKPVSSIMTREFVVVRASLDVDSLTRFLLERKLTCAAVSNQSGALVGFVSMIDLVREHYLNGDTEDDASAGVEMRRSNGGELRRGFHVEGMPRATVSDIMMPFVLRLPETAPIDEAAALMASECVHRVLIVSPVAGHTETEEPDASSGRRASAGSSSLSVSPRPWACGACPG